VAIVAIVAPRAGKIIKNGFGVFERRENWPNWLPLEHFF